MKVRLSILILGMALAGGCMTVETRIEEKQAVFTSLPVETQERLRHGEIAVGDSKDMVYIALGKPDRKYQRITAAGLAEDVWSYSGVYYTREIAWPRHRVFRRQYDCDDFFYFHGPDVIDVRHEYEQLRVEFVAGQVSVIEQNDR